MGKTVYTVVGQSAIRPEGLPEGLSVEASTSQFRKQVSGFLVEDSVITPGNAFVYQEASGLDRHITRADVVALCVVLTEWLNESVTVLRVVHDGSDSSSSNWRWYEIDTDKFVYHLSEDSARREAKQHREGTYTKDSLTFDQIKSDYGVRSIVSWEV